MCCVCYTWYFLSLLVLKHVLRNILCKTNMMFYSTRFSFQYDIFFPKIVRWIVQLCDDLVCTLRYWIWFSLWLYVSYVFYVSLSILKVSINLDLCQCLSVSRLKCIAWKGFKLAVGKPRKRAIAEERRRFNWSGNYQKGIHIYFSFSLRICLIDSKWILAKFFPHTIWN